MGNIYSASSDGSQGSHWARGRERGEVTWGGGLVGEWKTDKQEDGLILQGVNQKMRGRDGVCGGGGGRGLGRVGAGGGGKAEIPSSGFFH